jgi:hypothetical protein
MAATQQAPTRQQGLFEPVVRLGPQDATDPYASPPIVAAVEPSTAHGTADTAGRLARELGAPLVFAFVRPRRRAILGAPYYQRPLTRDLLRGRQTLDTALAAASRHGVMLGRLSNWEGAAKEELRLATHAGASADANVTLRRHSRVMTHTAATSRRGIDYRTAELPETA